MRVSGSRQMAYKQIVNLKIHNLKHNIGDM
jgi:hypothetical protein